MYNTVQLIVVGDELCDKKRCTIQGQTCVVKENNRAECRCRDSCPDSIGEEVCGSDGITYESSCHLDMTSCKLGGITMISTGKCQVISLKVSPAHRSSQTLIIGKPGGIHCGIEGKAAQVLWRKVGMKHRLLHSRVKSSNSKTLRFRRVQEQDAGQYVCRAISMSATVTATVSVSVEAIKGPKPGDTSVASNRVCNLEKLVGTGTDEAKFSPRWFLTAKGHICVNHFSTVAVGAMKTILKPKLLASKSAPMQLAMSVVSPNSLACVWGIFRNGSIAPKLENVSFLFMVVAKEMPTTLILRRSVKRLVQLTLFVNFSQKADHVEDIFPDSFSTRHLGSVISLFTVVVRETAIVFLPLSCARRSVN